jgi:perosamine synthetase
MISEFIPVNEPLLDGNEKKYLLECIDSGWISSEGPFVERFEKEFALRLGRKHAISVTNGTAALDAAIEALGIKKGDEVILPAFTIISCVLQIVRIGAVPILIDADPLSWNMDVSKIESKITSKTKAVMVVHIYGLPVDMDPVINICKKFNLKLIEDSAEMIGQTYKNNKCGSFGDISTVSFYSNKHVTTGEGGMIFTDDDNLAKRCKELRNLCFQPEKRFVHEKIGWNLRLTNLQAAVGLAQLEQLDRNIEKKRRIGNLYNQLLNDIDIIQLPLPKTQFAENIYWVYGIVLKEKINIYAIEVMKRLISQNIDCRPFFYSLHQQPVFIKMGMFQGESYPISEKISRLGFYLPSGIALKSEQIIQVTEVLKKILRQL